MLFIFVLVIVLCPIVLFGYLRAERTRRLRWPEKLSATKMAELTRTYFQGHGWLLEQPKDDLFYHFIANKGPLRFFLSCVDGTLLKSMPLSRFLERMESTTSHLRGLHRLLLVFVTDVQFNEVTRKMLLTRGLIIFHYKELQMVRDLADIAPDQFEKVDERQLRILANSSSALGKFIDASVEKKNWPMALHMAALAAGVSAADSYAHARLERIKRMAETEAIG